MFRELRIIVWFGLLLWLCSTLIPSDATELNTTKIPIPVKVTPSRLNDNCFPLNGVTVCVTGDASVVVLKENTTHQISAVFEETSQPAVINWHCAAVHSLARVVCAPACCYWAPHTQTNKILIVDVAGWFESGTVAAKLIGPAQVSNHPMGDLEWCGMSSNNRFVCVPNNGAYIWVGEVGGETVSSNDFTFLTESRGSSRYLYCVTLNELTFYCPPSHGNELLVIDANTLIGAEIKITNIGNPKAAKYRFGNNGNAVIFSREDGIVAFAPYGDAFVLLLKIADNNGTYTPSYYAIPPHLSGYITLGCALIDSSKAVCSPHHIHEVLTMQWDASAANLIVSSVSIYQDERLWVLIVGWKFGTCFSMHNATVLCPPRKEGLDHALVIRLSDQGEVNASLSSALGLTFYGSSSQGFPYCYSFLSTYVICPPGGGDAFLLLEVESTNAPLNAQLVRTQPISRGLIQSYVAACAVHNLTHSYIACLSAFDQVFFVFSNEPTDSDVSTTITQSTSTQNTSTVITTIASTSTLSPNRNSPTISWRSSFTIAVPTEAVDTPTILPTTAPSVYRETLWVIPALPVVVVSVLLVVAIGVAALVWCVRYKNRGGRTRFQHITPAGGQSRQIIANPIFQTSSKEHEDSDSTYTNRRLQDTSTFRAEEPPLPANPQDTKATTDSQITLVPFAHGLYEEPMQPKLNDGVRAHVVGGATTQQSRANRSVQGDFQYMEVIPHHKLDHLGYVSDVEHETSMTTQ